MRRLLLPLLVMAGLAVSASPALASTKGYYCNRYLSAHETCVHTGWHNDITTLEARSTGSALARIWVSNNSTGQVGSAQADSPCDGCWALIGWNSSVAPDGYPTTYNRNTFGSSFQGDFWF